MLGLLEWRWLGVFIALNHQNNRWGWLLSMDALDSPVRQPRHPTVRVLTQSTVGALTSGGTEQSGAAPDRHYSLSSAPLTRVLTSAANCSAVRALCSRPLRWRAVTPLGAPDSPVAHQTIR
jgi:hypothetical protein